MQFIPLGMGVKSKFTIILLIPLILSIGIAPAISFGVIDSPYQQMKNGIAAKDVICKSGLALMIRTSGNAVCVTPSSAEKLTAVGFGTIEKEASAMTETSADSCSDEQLLIKDKTNNQSCVNPQDALQKILDGATIVGEPTLKISQLITALALSASDSETLSQQEIFNIATLAYVYGYSPVDVMEARELMAKDPETGEFSVNTMINSQELFGPDWTAVVSPNTDTLYSIPYLDLAEEPLVFHVPDLGDRYYTFQLIDFYTNNFDYIGKRTTGTDENNFVIVGPNWTGDIPSELDRIDSPTPSIFLAGRTLVSGEEDVPVVNAIQEEYTLTKLSDWKEGKTSPPQTMPYPTFEIEGDFAFFNNMNVAVTENPPPSNEQNLVDLFAKINVGPNQTFDEDALDDTTKQTIKDAIIVGDSIVTYGSDNVGEKINGWYIPSPETGEFGENFILRAGLSKSMLYLNSPVEAMYPKALEDLDGDLLTGENKYVIHFDVDKLPPVDAFWSVTMYNSKFLLVDNEIDRYNIGDRTPGLKYGEDGSLDIFIQHEAPEDISNWLPAPADSFYLLNRLYNPQEPALTGEWTPSGVEKKNLNESQSTQTATTEDDRPNILVIVMDDVGFADLGFTASEINTPVMNALADSEILMTNFHVMPTCSPTRSVLLTGVDNHHTGFGSMSEFLVDNQKDQPGYEGYLNYDVVTVASLLQDADYHTYMTGKWHMSYGANVKNMTDEDLAYDNWGKYDPYNRGFEESFSVALAGSHYNEIGQTYGHEGFYTRNAERVTLPDDFYSGTAYVDVLIEMIDKNHGDGKPMFMYLPFWESHFPIHAPNEYVEKYDGVYDKGWDEIRKDRFEKQKEMGIIPVDLEFPPRLDDVPAWDTLTPEEQAIEAKKMQVFAGMTDSLDDNIERTIQHLKDIGEWDNTLLFIFSDNGAESTNIEEKWLGADDEDKYHEWMTQFDNSVDGIGTDRSNTSIGLGWSQVGSTPLYREKGFQTEGGTLAQMIVKVPGDSVNFKNNAFTHVIDITPTILDYAGVVHPGDSYDGRDVYPMDGRSLKPLFEGKLDRVYADDEAFGVELFGNKGVYKGDWKALLLGEPFGDGEWKLFNLAEDIRELNDLSSENPELLEELKKDYDDYAKRVGVIDPIGISIPR